ncbi:MAG: hypothetical protein V8R40_10955 [Dysosmobacter sp.]
MEKTGVDMIGEVAGIFADEESFNSNVVSLASYAFGQTFNVTPLELIRPRRPPSTAAICIPPMWWSRSWTTAAPWSSTTAPPVRQVISEETSARVRECLEYVVAIRRRRPQRPGGRLPHRRQDRYRR